MSSTTTQHPPLTEAEVNELFDLSSPQEIAEAHRWHVSADDNGKNGQPYLVDFLFDASPSMEDLIGTTCNEFVNTILPALRGVSRKFKGPMRVGAMPFAEKRSQAWAGARPLDVLGSTPLLPEMFRRAELGAGSTALYDAMICGLRWTAKLLKRMPHCPLGKVIVFTDGADNSSYYTAARVASEALALGSSITPYLVYFQTGSGLSEAQSKVLAKDTSFVHLGYYDITKGGEEQRQRNFRNAVGLFSSQLGDLDVHQGKAQ